MTLLPSCSFLYSHLALYVTFPDLGTPHFPGLHGLSFGVKQELRPWFWVHFPIRCSDGASPPFLAGLLPIPPVHVAATSVLLLGENYIITGNILSHPL